MFKLRPLVPVAVIALAAVAPRANAAVPAELLCSDTKKVNCFRDEIFILDGAAVIETPGTQNTIIETPAGGCKIDIIAGKEKPICTDLLYKKAAILVAQTLQKAGFTETKWDTFAMFGAGFPAERKVNGSGGGIGPSFQRIDDVNEVDGIGRPIHKRGSYPYIGFIAGGSTTNFGTFVPPDLPPPKGLAQWPEPDPAGVTGYAETYPECDADALCFPGFQNGYQALAGAVGQLFGPYVEEGLDDRILRELEADGDAPPIKPALRSKIALPPFKDIKGSLVDSTGARIWNSLLSFDASLMGGNRWRINGDGLAETTLPSEFWAASPPYQGKQLSRFHPLELYLMGLAPSSDLRPITDYTDLTLIEVQTKRLLEVFNSSFSGLVESFGQLPFVPIKVKDTTDGGGRIIKESDRQFDPVRSIIPRYGSRTPDFVDAPHSHRMLWIVVTKPNDPEQTEKQINYMLRWRRGWNAYYYMLTSYRGRMITTADTLEDDSPYWEFGQPIDDEKTFVPAGGLQVEFPGPLPTPGSPIISTFARVFQTPGAAGALVFQPHANQPPIRIKGDQQHPGAINSLAVRMRLPVDAPANSAAIMQLEGGVNIRVPSDARSFLIPDGKFHTYSADLSRIPEYVNRDFTGFSFVPSTEPTFDLDIEFIRFAWVKTEDLGDKDATCEGVAAPDGFINTEDNCPNQYNPLQEDGDGDGIGDACEDYDQDGAPNLCDNCPTLTNSRQRDRDGDGRGDACDKSPGSGCFLQPESVAGPTPPSFVLLWLVVGATAATVVRRQRKRRR